MQAIMDGTSGQACSRRNFALPLMLRKTKSKDQRRQGRLIEFLERIGDFADAWDLLMPRAN